MGIADLPHELEEMVRSELEKDERVLWVGQPIPSRIARQSWPAVAFAIPWTGAVLFWIVSAAEFRMPNFQNGIDFFPLFGVPFLLIGFGMLSSPYWVARKARSIAYVITDRRAMILRAGRTSIVHTYSPSQIGALARTQRPDGSGDILFEEKSGTSRQFSMIIGNGFLAIENAKDVEGMLKALQKPK